MLASWTYAPREWADFVRSRPLPLTRWETAKLALGVAVFTLAGCVASDAGAALPLAGAIGTATLLGIHGPFAVVRHGRAALPNPTAVIRMHGIRLPVDGVVPELVTSSWYLSTAKLRNDLPLPVIEICTRKMSYDRNGSRRTAEDVLRVPVPRGREDEAARVAGLLRRGVEVGGDDD